MECKRARNFCDKAPGGYYVIDRTAEGQPTDPAKSAYLPSPNPRGRPQRGA
jgi:hypothetical protein